MRIFHVALASLLLASAACGNAAIEGGNSAIDEYIDSLPYLPVNPAAVTAGSATSPSVVGDYSCTSENLTETHQLDSIVAYAANSDSLYPGALIASDSVATGLFTQIVVPRSPATISVSLENLQGTKKAIVANPSLSSYRDALSGILDGTIDGSTAANQYSEIEEVHSADQLNIALGVQAQWGLNIVGLKSSFDFTSTKTMSRYVVRYVQAYYTVDVDAPASPSQWMASSESLADVQTKMTMNSPPAYVSSVTYGREVLFTFESEYSSEEMSAALQFAVTAGLTDVSGNVSVTYKEMISQSKITGFVLGGDGGMAATIDSYDSLIAFIQAGGNYSKTSPGAPIAYKLSYLKDNSPARLSMTTNYDVQTCNRVSQKVQVSLEMIADDNAAGAANNALRIYGDIEASAESSDTLFSKDGANYVSIPQGQSYGGGASNPLAEGIINVVPSAGHSITLHAHLHHEHDYSSDDDLGDETVTIPFELGWRREETINLTGAQARVRVIIGLQPI